MPRHKAIRQSDFPYNISARCINRDWFSLPIDVVWGIFCEELTRASQDHELKIHSFVLMSNHFHLIASTPQANISSCMMSLMRRTSVRITRTGQRINETYAGRHFKCVLSDHSYYLNAYKYNYRNPVAAGICQRVEDYSFSTLHGLVGRSKLGLPVLRDDTLSSDPIGTLAWLNRPPDPLKLEAVRFGLKRAVFRSKDCPNSKRPLLELGDTL